MPAPIIPLFAGKPSHPFVPLGRRPAGARSEGQGLPVVGAPRAPFTGASTLAGWRSGGGSGVMAAILLLLAPGAMPVAASAQDVAAERALARHPYAVPVAEAARRFGIPDAWIWAVMHVESNGDSRAVSTAGALGLMQIMPATWASLRARYGLGADPFNVRDNILAGAAYLREMHDRYGNTAAMLAAYNAGPGRYDEHLSRDRPLPAETRAYLVKLAAITGGAGDDPVAVAPSPDPFAWRRAALFAVRTSTVSERSAGVDDDAVPTPPTHLATDRGTVTSAAVTPPSPGLFVALSSRAPR